MDIFLVFMRCFDEEPFVVASYFDAFEAGKHAQSLEDRAGGVAAWVEQTTLCDTFESEDEQDAR